MSEFAITQSNGLDTFDEKLKQFLEKNFTSGLLRRIQERIQETLDVLKLALNRFGFESIALSFNGGKDCEVLLFLYLYIVRVHSPADHPIPTLYVTPVHSFPQVDCFVEECSKKYNLHLFKKSASMKRAFAEFLNEHRVITAVLIGTRRNDPYAQDLEHIQQTDHGWPHFIRVHPIIDWKYEEIWEVLHMPESYSDIVSEGYTSLGGATNTIPNPALRMSDGSYLPAYLLKDQSQERLGRI